MKKYKYAILPILLLVLSFALFQNFTSFQNFQTKGSVGVLDPDIESAKNSFYASALDSEQRVQAWALRELLETQLIKYETTKKLAYLELALEQAEYMIRYRDDLQGRTDNFRNVSGAKVWSVNAQKLTCGVSAAFLVHQTVWLRPLMEMLYIYLSEYQGTMVDKRVSRIRNIISEFYETLDYFYQHDRLWRDNGLTFKAPTQESFICDKLSGFELTDSLPLNQMLDAGSLYHQFYDFADRFPNLFVNLAKNTLQARGNKVLTYVMAQMSVDSTGGIIWAYSKANRPEDTAHSVLVFDYLVRNYKRGLIPYARIIQARRTFHNLYNNHYNKVKTYLYDNPSTGIPKYIQALTRLVRLADFDASIYHRIRNINNYYQGVKDDGSVVSGKTKIGMAGLAWLKKFADIEFANYEYNASAYKSGVVNSLAIRHTMGSTILYRASGGPIKQIAGKNVSGCLKLNFGSVKSADIRVMARHRGNTPVDQCVVPYCGTSPGFYVFSSHDGLNWDYNYYSKLSTSYKSLNITVANPFRYALICRGAGGHARDNIEITNIFRDLK